MSETLTSDVTTIVEPGTMIRFKQYIAPTADRGVTYGPVIHGTVTGLVRHLGKPFLTVSRRADRRTVVVALNEVVKVCQSHVAPLVTAPVREETPVIEAPAQSAVPERARPVVTAEATDADITDRVRYVSPNGRIKVGVVVEIDSVSAIIEVGKPSTLELIDRGDIMAVLAA